MDKQTIKCKKCGTEIEISEALTHQIEERIRVSEEAKHQIDIENARKTGEENAQKQMEEKFQQQVINLQKENEDEKGRNKKLISQIDEMLNEIRKLRAKDDEREIEMKKKLMEAEDNAKKEARRQADEENQTKILEKDKKLNDALKQIDELKNKIQQGSQQIQGEVIELELERILINEFPQDIIQEVKKGERGADIIHEVIDKRGRKSGTILWESKNAQWKNDWPSKLKEDQRAKNYDLAVLVTINKPNGLDSFTYREGVWLTTWQFVIPLAFALRFSLISINHEKEKISGQEKQEKKEILYQYFTGAEFKNRVEAIIEAFSNLQGELEKEKRWFNAKWGREEKDIRRIIDQTYGMYGDLQSMVGRALPTIKSFELAEGLEENNLSLVTELNDNK
ncbi:DUF2130 domain-containing protein [Candidatus Daviesbacteria bacterium]|nr:DUF2130 domain-containing protein [Candidatus Daviesbacteria bacterium]